MGKYFGTDGIRGKNERFTDSFVKNIVDSLLKTLNIDKPKILIGGDTRLSTEKILSILTSSLKEKGVEVLVGKILPTPAISYLTKYYKCDCSIIVTASHNPYTDNGIKIINNEGEKLTDQFISKIEDYMDNSEEEYKSKNKGSILNVHEEALNIYKKKILSCVDINLNDLKIGIDCANGATSVIAPDIFKTLGAECTIINDDKSFGTNINNNCGSTHLEAIKKLVRNEKLDYGIAYDGDGDRCLMVDSDGNEIDGDHILAILANDMSEKFLVITVMANQGLLNWASKNNVNVIITDVGDTNVYEEMKNQKINIGGEQSGHIILRNFGMHTGDGILTSVTISKIVKKNNKSLKEVGTIITKFPQLIKNVLATDREKEIFKSNNLIQVLINKYNKILDKEEGRLNIRASGTENLIRITMWGRKMKQIEKYANNMAAELKNILEGSK